MTTKNIEKEFKIETIASLLENRLLKTTEYELYELCSFISGEDISKINFYSLGLKIKNILLELQPELNIRINRHNSKLYDVDVRAILKVYRNLFGDKYLIKSVNKCLIKSLEIRD